MGDSTYPGHRGTTSACAENTPSGAVTAEGKWNYLRVRGEYATPLPVFMF